MSYKFGLASAFTVGALAIAQSASATTCNVPNTFSAGTPAIASQVNSNFSSLQSCGNNIDSSNISANGIYASQLKPTSAAQATFGGTQNYTFSNGLTSPSTITTSTSVASNVADGTAAIIYPSNNGVNYSAVGVNSGSGYSGFSIAKLNSSQVFQSFLMGIDINGNSTFAGNGVFGSAGSFNGSLTSTSFSTPGAISGGSGVFTGNVSSNGTIQAVGNVTAGGQINSTGTMTNGGTTVNGALVANAAVTASSSIAKQVAGTNYGILFNADETSGSANNHSEHGAIPDANGSLLAGACDGPFNVTFARLYDTIPSVTASGYTATTGQFIITSVYNITTTGFTARTCNPTASTYAQPQFIEWIALGE